MDWTEDFGHENGRYQCRCVVCHVMFYGHKRRVTCKACDSATPSSSADILTITPPGNGEVIRIAPDGRLFWHGSEVETDADFRSAMLDLAKHLAPIVDPRSARRDIPGHCATRWQIDGDARMVTLFFDNVPNMEAFIVSIRSVDSRSDKDG